VAIPGAGEKKKKKKVKVRVVKKGKTGKRKGAKENRPGGRGIQKMNISLASFRGFPTWGRGVSLERGAKNGETMIYSSNKNPQNGGRLK